MDTIGFQWLEFFPSMNLQRSGLENVSRAHMYLHQQSSEQQIGEILSLGELPL